MHCFRPSGLRQTSSPDDLKMYEPTVAAAKHRLRTDQHPSASALLPVAKRKLDLLGQAGFIHLRQVIANANLFDHLQSVLEEDSKSFVHFDVTRRLSERVITLIEEIPELDEDDSSDEDDEAVSPVDTIKVDDFRHGEVILDKMDWLWHNHDPTKHDEDR